MNSSKIKSLSESTKKSSNLEQSEKRSDDDLNIAAKILSNSINSQSKDKEENFERSEKKAPFRNASIDKVESSPLNSGNALMTGAEDQKADVPHGGHSLQRNFELEIGAYSEDLHSGQAGLPAAVSYRRKSESLREYAESDQAGKFKEIINKQAESIDRMSTILRDSFTKPERMKDWADSIFEELNNSNKEILIPAFYNDHAMLVTIKKNDQEYSLKIFDASIKSPPNAEESKAKVFTDYTSNTLTADDIFNIIKQCEKPTVNAFYNSIAHIKKEESNILQSYQKSGNCTDESLNAWLKYDMIRSAELANIPPHDAIHAYREVKANSIENSLQSYISSVGGLVPPHMYGSVMRAQMRADASRLNSINISKNQSNRDLVMGDGAYKMYADGVSKFVGRPASEGDGGIKEDQHMLTIESEAQKLQFNKNTGSLTIEIKGVLFEFKIKDINGSGTVLEVTKRWRMENANIQDESNRSLEVFDKTFFYAGSTSNLKAAEPFNKFFGTDLKKISNLDSKVYLRLKNPQNQNEEFGGIILNNKSGISNINGPDYSPPPGNPTKTTSEFKEINFYLGNDSSTRTQTGANTEILPAQEAEEINEKIKNETGENLREYFLLDPKNSRVEYLNGKNEIYKSYETSTSEGGIKTITKNHNDWVVRLYDSPSKDSVTTRIESSKAFYKIYDGNSSAAKVLSSHLKKNKQKELNFLINGTQTISLKAEDQQSDPPGDLFHTIDGSINTNKNNNDIVFSGNNSIVEKYRHEGGNLTGAFAPYEEIEKNSSGDPTKVTKFAPDGTYSVTDFNFDGSGHTKLTNYGSNKRPIDGYTFKVGDSSNIIRKFQWQHNVDGSYKLIESDADGREKTSLTDAEGRIIATGDSLGGEWHGAVSFFDHNGAISEVVACEQGVNLASYNTETNAFDGIEFEGVMSTEDIESFHQISNVLRKNKVDFLGHGDNAKYTGLVEALDYVESMGMPISSIENFNLAKQGEFTLNKSAVIDWANDMAALPAGAISDEARAGALDLKALARSGSLINGARTIGWFLGNFLGGDLGDIGGNILSFGRSYSKSKILGEPTHLFKSSSFANLSAEAKMLRIGGPVAALVAFAAFLPAGIKDFKNAQANGASDAELAYRAFACIGGTIGGGISAAVDASQKGESTGIVARSFFAGLFGMYDPDNPGGFIEGVQRNRAEYQDQLKSRDALEGLVIPPNPKTGDPGFNGQDFVSNDFQAPVYNVELENAFYDYMKNYHPTSPAYAPRLEGLNGTYSGKNWFWAPSERPIWRIKDGAQGPVTSLDSLEIYKHVDQPEPGSLLYASSVSNTGGDIGGEYNPGPGAFGCWVAREVYGENNPRWLAFREWLMTEAPSWFRKLYFSYGPQVAVFIKDKPWLKTKIKDWMETKIDPHVDIGAPKYLLLMARYQEEKMGSVVPT